MSDWLDVEWTNGDVLTETKLDQMQENADYLRERVLRVRPIVNFWYGNHLGSGAVYGTPLARLRILIGATEIVSEEFTSATAVYKTSINNSLASISDDSLQTVKLELGVKPSATWHTTEHESKAWITPEDNYLSAYWYGYSLFDTVYNDEPRVYVQELSVLIHRVTMP